MKKKINLGILGFGFMGHCHAENIKKFEDIELIAVCDNNPHQLDDVRATKDFIIYENADSLISNSDINTVLIVVPNHLHKEMVIKAAKAGKDIICEKPAAMTVAEFDEMLKVVDECGVAFTVHHQRRWDKDFRITKEVYDKNLVGDMYAIKSSIYGINGNMHDWHIYKSMGGGMLYDWGVHLIDQLLYMVDSKIKTIFADVRNVINFEVDDYFKINLVFENGVVGEIELGTYYLSPKRSWTVCGNKGTMFIDGFDCKGKIVRTTRLLENVPGKITLSSEGPTRSFGPPAPGVLVEEALPEVTADYSMFFENYIKAVNGEEEFVIKPDQVRRVLSVMEAARKSAELKKSVAFE